MFYCKFCERETEKEKSNIAHQSLCKLNPNRKIRKPSYGMLGKRGANQYTYGATVKDETREKLSIRSRGRKLSEKTKEKLSYKRSKYLEEVGGGGFTHIKFYKEKNILGEVFTLRDTWELEVARWLNIHNILWVRKKYLNYVDGHIKTYTPDFYLPEKKKYLEVKGFLSEKDKTKLRLVNNYNQIEIILIKGKNIQEILRECHIRVNMPVL